MIRTLSRLFALLLIFAVPAAVLGAQDLGSVRQSMRQRLPELDALKSAGAVGEDNRGYVAMRESRDRAAELVAEENADRRVVYQSIAQQTGSSADAVGKARARQIAAQSAAGVWLQGDDGQWYRKK